MEESFEGTVIRRKSTGEETRIVNGKPEEAKTNENISGRQEKQSAKIIELKKWKEEREKDLDAFKAKKKQVDDYMIAKRNARNKLDELFERKAM